MIAGVHNGTSEAANASGLIFAVWMGWRFGREPSLRGALWLAVGLLWATLSSWYVAVLAFGYAGLVALFAAKSWPLIKRWLPIGVGLVLVAPWLWGVMHLLQPGRVPVAVRLRKPSVETANAICKRVIAAPS